LFITFELSQIFNIISKNVPKEVFTRKTAKKMP